MVCKVPVLALAVTLLAGCSTVSPVCSVPTASGPQAANLVIYRPGAMVGVLYATPMSIDHCRINDLDDDAYVVYRLPPGMHRIAAEKRALELGSGAQVEALFEAGKTYYLRQHVNLVAGLAIVDRERALSEMPRLEGLFDEN